jgi:hypothetical protein
MNDHSNATGPKGPMAGSMQGSQAHKRKSSLTRETLVKIGAHLQVPYNEIVSQGVPDRFVTLLHRLETGEISAPEEPHEEGVRGESAASDEKGS